MTIAISGTTGITLDGQFNSASSMGFKNRIINGAMVIDQRNAGASVSAASGSYYVDRFLSLSAGSTWTSTFQRSSTAPTGFNNSLLLTTSTTKTPSATEGFVLGQKIEGYNLADLGWGTANAQTITISFWVRSSLIGAYSVSLINNAFDRSYVSTYTISSANTWEQKTITIAGDTTGTWEKTTSAGVLLYFSVSNSGGGTNTTSSLNAWQAANNYLGSTTQVNLFNASSATFYITGVQLEKGSTATSFDYRPYGTELALCQRYYQTIDGLMAYGLSSTTTVQTSFTFPVMRAAPSFALGGTGSGLKLTDGAADRSASAFSITTQQMTDDSFFGIIGTYSSITQYRPYAFARDGGMWIQASAEL